MEFQKNMSDKTNLDICEAILGVIENYPGLKAKDIASKLNVDRNTVNSPLYGTLRDKVFQDKKYTWYLKEDAPALKKQMETTHSQTALSNLANYYLSCLSQDDLGGVSVFADNKYGDLDYAELGMLPDGLTEGAFVSPDVKKLFGKIRSDRNRLEMYMGYPCALKKVRSKKGWEGFFVEPILLFQVETEHGNSRLNTDYPLFNFSVLKRYSNSEQENIMDELVQLENELGLSADNDIPDLDEIARRLEYIRPEWPWREPVIPDNLTTEPLLKDIDQEGIYNKCVFVVAERSPYTKGLESELKDLSRLSAEQYAKTTLGQWVNCDIPVTQNANSRPLLEVLPLNLEQRQAIQKSLRNSLTVITGPPGTGKSQVVTNLLINAAWQGKKVLFASKNNKAVDVVEIRINDLGSRPILLRMGSSQYQIKLAEYLMSLLSSQVSEYAEEEFKHNNNLYGMLEDQLIKQERKEKELINTRNATDRLSQELENFRNSISSEVFEYLKDIDLITSNNTVANLNDLFNKCIRTKQNLICQFVWPLIRKAKYDNFLNMVKMTDSLAKYLELDVPTNRSVEIAFAEWTIYLSRLQKKVEYARTIQDYLQSLESLQQMKSLETIARDKNEILHRLSGIANKIWLGWLQLQSSQLSAKDRNTLNKYKTLLKMVIDCGGDIYSNLGKSVYRNYARLSSEVSHLLPAWAVTSLSAKGKIPFEAGYFDIVIFDEASQCDIASALPLLYRAKQAVVIGDPKQLSHISTLKRGQDQQLMDRFNLIGDFTNWAYSYNSLFDLASSFVSSDGIVNLRDHHRSHSDIIEFSNRQFYEGNLRVATNYNLLKFVDSGNSGIRWLQVSGLAQKPPSGGAINENEARKVITELKRLVIGQDYTGSIGIVTPFRAQANFIRQIVSEDKTLSSELIKNDFLVDTVHKFQGDERDLMIFSPVVSQNTPSGALRFLQNNGNLFNVAITRARAMLLVIGDINEFCDLYSES
jgi:hypothetical protein